jgi:hypothetical protein
MAVERCCLNLPQPERITAGCLARATASMDLTRGVLSLRRGGQGRSRDVGTQQGIVRPASPGPALNSTRSAEFRPRP